MREKPTYWQSYWYHLRFREKGTPSFLPMGPGGPRQVSNQALSNGSLEEFVERFLNQAVDELDDLRGELQILVYSEAAPAPDAEPVLIRTITLGRVS